MTSTTATFDAATGEQERNQASDTALGQRLVGLAADILVGLGAIWAASVATTWYWALIAGVLAAIVLAALAAAGLVIAFLTVDDETFASIGRTADEAYTACTDAVNNGVDYITGFFSKK